MLGSNPSADSVASTDVGGAAASPFHLLIAKVPTIGRGNQALNPGGAGAKPPQAVLAANFLLKHGRPLIMHGLHTPRIRRLHKLLPLFWSVGLWRLGPAVLITFNCPYLLEK